MLGQNRLYVLPGGGDLQDAVGAGQSEGRAFLARGLGGGDNEFHIRANLKPS